MQRTNRRTLLAGALLALLLTVLLAFCSGTAVNPDRISLTDPAGTHLAGASSPTSSSPSTTPTHRRPASPTLSAAATGTSGSGSDAAPGGACASPGACGFPDASDTGPRIPLTPHSVGLMEITTNGTTISGWDITGALDIYADDVTVVDSRITSSNWWGINLRPGFSGLRVLHSTITGVPGKGPDNGGEDYAISNMGGSSIEVGWNNISVFGDALSMGQGDLHDNYVHGIVPFVNLDDQYQHTDAVISDGGNTGTLIIRHNTLLNPTDAAHGASASIGLYADTGDVANCVVDDNWLAGGAYSLYGGGTGANGIQVTDNVFSTEYFPGAGVYGPVAYWNAGGRGNLWSGNRMSDGTALAPPPPTG